MVRLMPLPNRANLYSGKKFIFVDFFDTLVFRRVSARAVIEKWGWCIQRKLSGLRKEDVPAIIQQRIACRLEFHRKGVEPSYEQMIGEVYDMSPHLQQACERSAFTRISRDIDVAIELGCQYPNRKLIRFLERAKKDGAKIVIVSDFYLPRADFLLLIEHARIPEGLLDAVYVSSDCGCQKATGTLYTHVLADTGADPKDVLMIGDSYRVDRDQAKEKGIEAAIYPHYLHKGLVRLGIRYNGWSATIRYCRRVGPPFSEYCNLLFLFVQRLYTSLQQDGARNVSFMAREGFYLRELFEIFQGLCVPENRQIATQYLQCSRRSVFSAIHELGLSANQRQTEENRRQLLDYIMPFICDERLIVVDSGWRCTTQAALERLLEIPTKGYYIGVCEGAEKSGARDTCGLIFDETRKSSFYGFLNSCGLGFYQQILSANHGSVTGYKKIDGQTVALVEWNEMEKRMFSEHFEGIQRFMALCFRGLCVWRDGKRDHFGETRKVAIMVLKSALFLNKPRYAFIQACDHAFVDNLSPGKIKQFDHAQVHVRIDVFVRPGKYAKYLSKVRRSKLVDSRIVRLAYPVVALCYFVYAWLIESAREGFKQILRKQRRNIV